MASGTMNDSLHYEWMIMHNEKPIIPQTWTESQPVLALATHYHHQDSDCFVAQMRSSED